MTDNLPEAVREYEEFKRDSIGSEYPALAGRAVSYADAAIAALIGDRASAMRCFTVYRKAVPMDTHDENQANGPDEPQFEGVIFSDGRVAVRWLTAYRSVSVWDSYDDLMKIHGHPEYGSEVVWHD